MSSFTEAMVLVDELFVDMARKNMKRLYAPMIRVNTRIMAEQHKFIKDEAKRTKRTEGEVFRLILDTYINQKLFNTK